VANITPEQALAELARRELAGRQGEESEMAAPTRLRGMREGEGLSPGGFVDATAGVGEVGISGLGSLAAQIAAGPLALAQLTAGGLSRIAEPPGTSLNRASNIIERGQAIAQDILGPRTQEGQAIAEGLGNVAEPAGEAFTDVLETPYPLLSAALKTGLMGTAELGLGRGAGRAITPKPKPGTFIPSIRDLYAAGRVAFNEARISGGGIKPNALGRLHRGVSEFRNEAGIRVTFDRDLHGPAVAVRQRIQDAVDSNTVDFDELLTLRELAGDVAGSPEPGISYRGVLLKNQIDDFVDSLKPDDVLSGDPARAARSLETARNLWRDASKARTIEKEIELAGNRAGQFSGSGYENALRTQFRQLSARIIRGTERGWTEAEIKAIKRVASGGGMDNVYRMIGKLAPTGVVSGGIGAGIGYTAFGPIGAAAVPAGGALGRYFATKGTIGNVQRALELPLTRSVFDETDT
jgi:hypothetical protein